MTNTRTDDNRIQTLSDTYTIQKAGYAKGMMAVHCKPDGTGWKTLAALIISEMPGVQYSGRERSYICSPGRAAKFDAEMAGIQKKREALTPAAGPEPATAERKAP
jgi:hypothetical protein